MNDKQIIFHYSVTLFIIHETYKSQCNADLIKCHQSYVKDFKTCISIGVTVKKSGQHLMGLMIDEIKSVDCIF